MSKVNITKPQNWIPVIYAPKFFKWWSKLNGFDVAGMTLPFVILTKYHDGSWDEYNIPKYKSWFENKLRWWKGHIQHESIHIHQQLDLLFIGFFIAYGLNYVWNRVIKRQPHYEAYMNIVFEKEAYNAQYIERYLDRRKPFQWITFLKQKNEYFEASQLGHDTVAYENYAKKYGLNY